MLDNSILLLTPHANYSKVVSDAAVNSGEMAKLKGWDGYSLGSCSLFLVVEVNFT